MIDHALLRKSTYTGSEQKGHAMVAAAPHHKEFHAPHVYHPSSICMSYIMKIKLDLKYETISTCAKS